MPEFFNVLPPSEAFNVVRKNVVVRAVPETIATDEALGRVTASEVLSPEVLPAFPRSTMDGYSVRARDTFGASEGMPAYLEVVGKVSMGKAVDVSLSTGQTAEAYTGGGLAQGADAVVMVEHTQVVNETTIEVTRSVAPGENVVQVGEDVSERDSILPAGQILRPQDIGGLMALGITEIDVFRRPRVAIVSTGDELVPPTEKPGPGIIRDINTFTISSLVTQAGGIPIPQGLVADVFEAQREAAVAGIAEADILVFSAGSSVSSRDMTADVIEMLGEPGVLVHGISIRPGKPSIVGVIDGKPVFGLPGNPVSAMVVFGLLVRPTIYLLSGCAEPPRPATIRARLVRDIASQTGREDHVPVKLSMTDGVQQADPVFGKSNLIYTLVRSDGMVTVPIDDGGLYAGDEVSVRLY
ncbi:MAG: molybdopterin-binding protein [SAR202 cluster bacterium]|jgi:molybdopterin molybdotransferase|nr:molybdopterin-binding protein [SAR202 cluster bacterium]MDP6073207.1 molybdopterin-binding protein [SAR202 cluster bacterium]MDP6301863.1 molybdopterin-binding protein [SAR202 cluster bacterium]MDP7104590.1 molybdopterin-binding protein [SAR202 cluster bacterium]MDP7415064.1 molybdopterin-binding protein [SAR202 cluster bacterium]|tara:strand:+ start:636 stop:1868 length:1233 start_codon:yes stop_codon:yes gene_type:complete